MPKRSKSPLFALWGSPLSLKTFVAILIIGVVLTGFYILSTLGPKPLSPEAIEAYQAEAPGLEEARQEVASLVAEFDGMEEIREITKADLLILQHAMERQQEIIDANYGNRGVDVQLLEELRRRYDEYQGGVIYKESLRYEAIAEKALAAGDYNTALLNLRKSRQLQESINKEYGLGSYRDLTRLIQLTRLDKDILAQPLYEESLEAKKKSIEAIEAGKWKKGEDYLIKAIELQTTINEDHRESKFAGLAHLEELQSELTSIKSGQSHQHITELIEEARKKEQTDQPLEAAELYREAIRIQQMLNERYRESRFASSQRIEELESLLQTTQSKELAQSITEKNRQLDIVLAERRTHQAISLIIELSKSLQQLHSNFPKSHYIDNELLLKNKYLTFMQEEIAYLQDKIFDQLVPILPEKGWLMLRTEVSQLLYSRIMANNPSRNHGEQLPVDSISFAEASDFCRRLSWIMGREVRLPTPAMFEKAVGDLRYAPLYDWTWNAENSGNTTHPVGTKEANRVGLYDILGNVNEWLDPGEWGNESQALIGGGSAHDPVETLLQAPSVGAPKTERNRFTGFRFVIKFDLNQI